MPPADTLESSSDSVQDCIHQYDPALYKLEHRSDDDHKVQFLSDAAKFTPPATFKFPVTTGRKYNPSWEKTRPWLRYIVKSDSAYCAYCLCFGTVLNSPFVNQGFKNWGKAVGVKDGYLDRHANSADHISSSERVFGFLHCIKKCRYRHTHFDWIGTDTWAWIPNINTGIDTWYRYLLRRHPPPRIWARLRPCYKYGPQRQRR